MTTEVRIALDLPISNVNLQVGLSATRVRVQLPLPLGEIKARLGQVNEARINISDIIGPIRLRVRLEADTWALAGLPAPTIDFSYVRNVGLQRHQMESGAFRQRKKYFHGLRNAALNFKLPINQLKIFEDFVISTNYSWFTIGLVTGDNQTPAAAIHTVRIIDIPKFSDFKALMCKATLIVDILD